MKHRTEKYLVKMNLMNFKFLQIIISFIIFIFISCKQNISEPKNFKSFGEVELFLRKNQFLIDESADTSNSDWITSANFKSQDGKKGFLTLGMRGKKYYFDRVPLKIWEDFKFAKSKGKFYHKYIKGKYSINLK